MKTLDEVIFEAPYSPTPWEADALHYLNEYQGLQIAYLKAMADLEDNPPLTWDELKTMEGKPVWVVVDEKERWRIIREVTNEHLMLESGLPLHKCWMNHPDGWQAYRKERYEDLG